MGLWLLPKEAENMHSNSRNDSPLIHLEVFVGWALPTEMQQVYLLKRWEVPTLRHYVIASGSAALILPGAKLNAQHVAQRVNYRDVIYNL